MKNFITVTYFVYFFLRHKANGFETIRPAWLDQTQRPPPPAQSQEAIDKLINSILAGDNQHNRNNGLFGGATTVSSSQQQEDIGPLAIANSSHYWSWHDVKPRGSISDELDAKNFLDEYESEAEKVYFASVQAGWNYFTNLTEYNRKKLVGDNKRKFTNRIVFLFDFSGLLRYIVITIFKVNCYKSSAV